MDNIYLGTEIKSSTLKKEILKSCKKFKIVENIKNKKIAEWLSKGLIVARCRGRMEFGQRSLGNRSILADSRNYNNIDKINKKIKIRDFWMPFTPSLTIDGCKKILKNPKNIYSPYMTMAFDINKDYEKYLSAVIHPSDKSIRPQMLKRESNKDYYDLIKEYEKITGLPVLLNTSFNLHGDAIVENATQAISTFKRSDLDVLIINNFAIIRREKND
jgi:carbamoyltransferase